MHRNAPGLLALLVSAACLLARADGAQAQPIGVIDEPRDGDTVFGVVKVSGWVLDFSDVDKIELLVDGNLVNRADTNLPRADVLEVFPTYVGSATAQPGYLSSFLARNYPDGPHTITVRVTEAVTQAAFDVATITVVVDNSINQAPFGFIDIPGPTGLEGANGSFPVSGWALDDEDVDHIDFLVDGQVVAGAVGRGLPSTAIYGTTRPDVQAAFPDVPNSLFSGYQANIDATKLINGIHDLSVRVGDNRGASRVIGTRSIQVISNASNLAPFGQIDFPLDKASLFCSTINEVVPSPCTPADCGQVLQNVVAGWALDVGSRLDKGQVAYVELLLDGVILLNSRTDCIQLGEALVNCYGVNRPDVAQSYSGYVNADNAGFLFSFALISDPTGEISIGRPTPQPFVFDIVGSTRAGKHTLAVRVGDEEETVTQIGAMSVDILCDLDEGDRPAFGYIDTPWDYQFINGLFTVFGWAHDLDFGVQRIEIDVDGQVIATSDPGGGAFYGLERPDVRENDPRVGSRTLLGFSYLLDTTKLSDGEHDLVVYVVDGSFGGGRRSEIGRRKFVVNNNVLTHQ
jgi:hypothetical protein